MNNCLYCGKPVKNKYCNVSCQNKHQNSSKRIKKFGNYKMFHVKCKCCNKDFLVEERENKFPSKVNYYCSRSCSNKRIITEEHKRKTSETLKNKFINNKIESCCEWCSSFFYKKNKKQKFCSKQCAQNFITLNLKQYARIAGKKSAEKQSSLRRSKNEIYFSELCLKEFNDVKLNETIFNGWDADIIINDFKIAILWNGIWHYKKITKQHSVKQVQNRDLIKINEIKKIGYEPYIIKDLGKYNKSFVENEFNKLKLYCGVEKLGISPVS